jgi:hypothetical protein
VTNKSNERKKKRNVKKEKCVALLKRNERCRISNMKGKTSILKKKFFFFFFFFFIIKNNKKKVEKKLLSTIDQPEYIYIYIHKNT